MAAASSFLTPTSMCWSCCRARSPPLPHPRSSDSSVCSGTPASKSRTRCARSPNARRRWLETSRYAPAGSRALYQLFRRSIEATIDARAFYEAKTLEQQQRHLRYQDTAYNLEPNVKESPGGLRDLQTVVWIARAAGLGRSWRDFAARGLMTGPEAREVVRQERLLCDLRIRLHYLAGRREDRLVFDVQTALARDFGLSDTAERRASELLMQRYYRAAKSIRQISVVLLQNVHSR